MTNDTRDIPAMDDWPDPVLRCAVRILTETRDGPRCFGIIPPGFSAASDAKRRALELLAARGDIRFVIRRGEAHVFRRARA